MFARFTMFIFLFYNRKQADHWGKDAEVLFRQVGQVIFKSSKEMTCSGFVVRESSE